MTENQRMQFDRPDLRGSAHRRAGLLDLRAMGIFYW